MSKKYHRLKKYINSPYMQLFTGSVLLISGIASAYHEFVSADHSFRLGVHHGIILWALVQILGSIPDLIDGLDRSFEAIEQHHRA